ncbi:MAG: hypothetical protein R2851_23990 [Caldilineaceae bacterium]
MIDGLQNIMPYGTTTLLQTTMSNLLNAYKRNEIDPATGLGIFALSATLTDRRAERIAHGHGGVAGRAGSRAPSAGRRSLTTFATAGPSPRKMTCAAASAHTLSRPN